MNVPLNDDDYYRIETEYDYEYEDMSTYMFQQCAWSTVIQLVHTIYPILAVSFILLIFSFNNVPVKHLNVLNSLLSVSALFYLYNPLLIAYLLVFIVKIYLVLYLANFSQQKNAFIIIACSTVHMFMGRMFLFSVADWNSVKGIEMILIMKIISLVIDMKQKTPLNLTDLISYLLSVNTALFGPWVSYANHLAAFGHRVKRNAFVNTLNSVKSFCISIVCLIGSSCLLNLVDPYLNINPFIRIYFEAFSFRLSNYFVAFLSQAIVNLSGNHHLKVTRPLFIEMPRSLLDVVTNWNIPIHDWLKSYVFKPIKSWKPKQTLFAVFTTYFVSSMLHAFDESISLILFSLGFYTYVEYNLRKNLSKLIGCCVQARKCSNGCGHKFKSNHLISYILNVCFSLVNVYHLAYLGQVLFHVNSSETSNGYEIAFNKWSATYYSSHLISLIYLIIFKLTQFLC